MRLHTMGEREHEHGVSRRALFTGLRRRLRTDEPAEAQEGEQGPPPLDPATRRLLDWGESDGRLWGHAADVLVEGAFVDAGERVLDAGAGDGNVALAAARRGAEVVACEPVEALVERGRERAADEGLEVDWRIGELEALPFDDGEFSCALSAFAPAFCARPRRALGDLARVTRPGGQLGVVLWTREGAIGRLLRLAAIAEPPPGGGQGPVAWGSVDAVRGAWKGWATLEGREPVTVRMTFTSVEEAAERLVTVLGPLAGALARLPADRAATLRAAVDRAVSTEAADRRGRACLTGNAQLLLARRGAE